VKGPLILGSEFETALGELKYGKAGGKNGISGELLKVLGGKGKKAV